MDKNLFEFNTWIKIILYEKFSNYIYLLAPEKYKLLCQIMVSKKINNKIKFNKQSFI